MIEFYPGAFCNMTEAEAKALGVDSPEKTIKQYTTTYILELKKKLKQEIAYRKADLAILEAELELRSNIDKE